MTTSVSAQLSQAEQIFYDLVWTPMLTAGENWLEMEIPFLNLPVIKQLDESALKAVTNAVFNSLVTLIDVTYIKWKNAANKSAYDSASLALAIVAQESGMNSDEYQKALATAIAAQSQFTQLPH